MFIVERMASYIEMNSDYIEIQHNWRIQTDYLKYHSLHYFRRVSFYKTLAFSHFKTMKHKTSTLILIFQLIFYFQQTKAGPHKNCNVEVKGIHSEKYFRWSMRSPVNYFEPAELDYFCKHEKGGHCRFPQNLRSKSYQGNKVQLSRPFFS